MRPNFWRGCCGLGVLKSLISLIGLRVYPESETPVALVDFAWIEYKGRILARPLVLCNEMETYIDYRTDDKCSINKAIDFHLLLPNR